MGPLVLALSSAVAYGVSDFFGGLASRRAAALRVLVVSYPISAVLMTLVALGVGGTSPLEPLLWGAAAGIAMAVAAWTFFLALAVGPVSIISPITALLGSAIPLVVGLALGEKPHVTSLSGVGLALVAVVLVSLSPHADTAATRPFTRTVAAWTFTAGLAFALSYVFTSRIPESAGLMPLVSARWTATLFILAIAASRNDLHLPPRGRALSFAVTVGVLDAVAHFTMLLALQQSLLSIGSVVISLFPAVTVLLAVLLLGERLTRVQTLGMGLAGAAIVLIGM
ncbi:DMT family transporter [Mobilicoccus massiliensis]|uniref:DMT family transporter n=1 Tax=Mobilicoccus massiliensis TaxID=1522310 RepID=UPI0006936912|nr:DMT family transporter [Mobilicoccus massiliensis]